MIYLPLPCPAALYTRILIKILSPRRQLTGGETIQSYNHQAIRKEESFPPSHQHHNDTNSADDDNIDVVNDDDKDSGKDFYHLWS